jgi:hypothetical protein
VEDSTKEKREGEYMKEGKREKIKKKIVCSVNRLFCLFTIHTRTKNYILPNLLETKNINHLPILLEMIFTLEEKKKNLFYLFR